MYIDQRNFEIWMQRLMSQFELINRKIDKLTNTENKINDEVLLDNQDLCLLLKVSKRTLQRFRSSGKLTYKRIGKKTYYLESDVHEFIQKGFNCDNNQVNRTGIIISDNQNTPSHKNTLPKERQL